MQIASGKEAPFNASYSSGVGSYTSSGTNFNPASPNSNLKLVSPTPAHKLAGYGARPLSYTNFQSPNVDIKNSIYSAYDIPNTDKLGSPLVHNEILAQEVRSFHFFYFTPFILLRLSLFHSSVYKFLISSILFSCFRKLFFL